MRSYDLTDFLTTSALLNYQLCAKQRNWSSITTVILEGKPISDHDQELLLHVLEYLSDVYGKMQRNLGPLSVLHPLRATALLFHASKQVIMLDLITCLLHDTCEDFKPVRFKDSVWIKLDEKFQTFLKEIPENHQESLRKHLQWLTKEPSETYYHYIGNLLDEAADAPEVVRVKLADRLDNTFDMRIDLQDPLEGVNFFEIVYQMVFTNTYQGIRAGKASSAHGDIKRCPAPLPALQKYHSVVADPAEKGGCRRPHQRGTFQRAGDGKHEGSTADRPAYLRIP
jgi:hypothetical protein